MADLVHKTGNFRGSEVTQLDIALYIKNWIIHKLIILSPLIVSLTIYFFIRFIIFINLATDLDTDLDTFSLIDKYIFVAIGIGVLGVVTFGIKWGKKWVEEIKKAEEKLVSDEYIRGAKWVCVDEFNNQFNDDEMLVFDVVESSCKRKF